MGFRCAGALWCAVADDGFTGDESRAVGRLCGGDGCGNRIVIVTIDSGCIPAGRFKALQLINRVGNREGAVDGNAVIVPQNNEAGEFQMTGKGDGFLRNAFHQIAVGGENIGVMIDEVVGEVRCHDAFAECEADGGCKSLPERSGGDFDA